VLAFEHCLIAVGAEPKPVPEGYTDAAAEPRVVPLHGAAVRTAALWLLLRGGDVAILGSSWAALEMACHLRQVYTYTRESDAKLVRLCLHVCYTEILRGK
jgi:hypothetical protein